MKKYPSEDFKEGYLQGLKDGVAAFIDIKNGVGYVGTQGLTLKEAHDLIDRGLLWNQKVVPKEVKDG